MILVRRLVEAHAIRPRVSTHCPSWLVIGVEMQTADHVGGVVVKATELLAWRLLKRR